MRMISKPVVCATDISASNRSVQSHGAMGGRYIVQKGMVLNLGKLPQTKEFQCWKSLTLFYACSLLVY